MGWEHQPSELRKRREETFENYPNGVNVRGKTFRYYAIFTPIDLDGLPKNIVGYESYDERQDYGHCRAYGHFDLDKPLTRKQEGQLDVIPDPRNPKKERSGDVFLESR